MTINRSVRFIGYFELVETRGTNKLEPAQLRLVATALCCLLATLGWRLPTVFALLALLVFIARSQAAERNRLQGALRRLEAFAATGCAGDVPYRLEHVANVLEEVALCDPERVSQRHSVTGVPTREPLLAKMATDHRGTLGIVRFVDFDRLSVFDPSQGHELLAQATARLKAMLPSSRMIAHVDRAHIGIWFGADVDDASAQIEMDAIVYALGEALPLSGRSVLPEVRVQLARFEDGDPAILLARTLARLSVTDMKTVEGVSPGDDQKAEKERFNLEQDLRRAAAANELQLRYQPLIDADIAGVCGAEALIRWRHPERGMIAPARFVPLLEVAGLAHEIGLWAINTACREARSWKTAELPELQIAVNVSAYQLERSDLPELVARTLERHALDPASLEIELTESAALGDSGHARVLFASLRELGVRIAIDDFGTGYSSLSTLRSLTFDKIKIDREFVSQVDTQKESQAICQSIIALGRGLGISVLAEGVERVEEYAWLRRHGCRKFQGYFFSPPLEGPAFVSFVRNREQLAAKLETGPTSLQRDIAGRLSA